MHFRANSKKTQSLGKNGCRQKCLDKSLYMQIYVYVAVSIARSLADQVTVVEMIDRKQPWKVMKINNWPLKMRRY